MDSDTGPLQVHLVALSGLGSGSMGPGLTDLWGARVSKKKRASVAMATFAAVEKTIFVSWIFHDMFLLEWHMLPSLKGSFVSPNRRCI